MKIFGKVYAHCDIPCGIYETDTITHSAHTCQVMVNKLGELLGSEDPDDQNNFARMVAVKEAHAEKVKHEVRIIWGDYFKPEHVEKYPDLHEKVWQIMRQASRVKQTISADETQKFIDQVADFAEIFADSKK